MSSMADGHINGEGLSEALFLDTGKMLCQILKGSTIGKSKNESGIPKEDSYFVGKRLR